jgi:hypothetical protein
MTRQSFAVAVILRALVFGAVVMAWRLGVGSPFTWQLLGVVVLASLLYGVVFTALARYVTRRARRPRGS